MMPRPLAILFFCGALLTVPAAAQAPQRSEPTDASLACFFVLLETSHWQTSQCGRTFSDEESRRMQRALQRLEAYVMEHGGPSGDKVLQTLRGQLARGVPDCGGQSLQLANRFIDEVVDDASFLFRLEETLGRAPNPLEGGCL